MSDKFDQECAAQAADEEMKEVLAGNAPMITREVPPNPEHGKWRKGQQNV